MSYEIIKSVTFYEKEKRIVIRSESNNIVPKYYDPWVPTDHGCDYSAWKRMLASSLFGGEAKFQPSCKSKAKRAYDRTNELLGISGCEPWVSAERRFPFERDYRNYPHGKTPDDELMRLGYEAFRVEWETLFTDVLNLMLGSVEPLEFDWSSAKERFGMKD